MFEIKLFGPPQFLHQDKPYSINRKMARMLLLYLAATGRPVSRDRLIDIFWPDDPEEEGRNKLRDTLNKLRSSLPDRDIVQSTAESLYIDLERVRIDVLDFEKKLEEVGQLPWSFNANSALPEAVYRELVQVTEAWKPGSFMAGLDWDSSTELDDWHRLKNVSLERAYLRVLERLSNHELASGNLAQAARWLQKAVQVDFFNDDFHFRYLNVLLDSGARSQARQHYEEVRRVYKKEGLSPSNAVLSLGNRIKDVREGVPVEKPVWPVRASMQIPFIGQEDILGRLEQVHHAGSGVVVFGEAGSGKTRLVQEFYQRLNPVPRLFLATCRPMELHLPFEPWIGLLRNSISEEEWKSFPAAWVGPITMILPELAVLRQDMLQGDVTHHRYALFSAIAQMFRSLGRDQQTILFVDDAHWADESSLDLLSYLIDHGLQDGNKVTLIVAARVEGENPHLDRMLRVHAPQRLKKLTLGLLTPDDIAVVVRVVWGENPPPVLVERLAMDTGGNPFFLLETLRALLDSPERPSLDSITTIPMASSVHQLIQTRLQSLREPVREVLLAAAVAGSRFTTGVIEYVSELSERDVADALDELAEVHLITDTPDGSAAYVFIHEKIRESLLSDLSQARKRLLHLKMAKAIQERVTGRDPREQASILAYHYEEAREYESAFDHWLQAGRYATRLTSVEQAKDAFRRAERLIPRAASLTDEQIFQLYIMWSDIAYEANETEELRQMHEYQLRLGEERKSDLLIGCGLDGLSDACLTVNQFEEGRAYCERAIPYLARSGNMFKIIDVHNHRGVFLFMENKLEEAREAFQTALALAGDSQDPQILRGKANAEYQLAISLTLEGWPEEGNRYGEQALNDFFRCNYPHGQVTAYSVITISNYYMGRYKLGREAGYFGIAMATRISAWRMLGYLHGYCALTELALGNISAAWHHAETCQKLGETYGYHEIISLSYRAMGDMYNRFEAIDRSEVMFRKGMEAGKDHFSGLDNMLRFGLVQIGKGRTEEGERIINEALERSRSLNLGFIHGFGKMTSLVIKDRLELYDDLENEIERALQELNERSWGASPVYVGEFRARMCQRRGDLDGAVAVLEEMIQSSRDMQHVWLEVRGLAMLLPLLQEMKRPSETHRTRLISLLAQIDAMTHNVPVRGEWLLFRKKLFSKLEL